MLVTNELKHLRGQLSKGMMADEDEDLTKIKKLMCLYCTLIIFIALIYCKKYENEKRLFNKILFEN